MAQADLDAFAAEIANQTKEVVSEAAAVTIGYLGAAIALELLAEEVAGLRVKSRSKAVRSALRKVISYAREEAASLRRLGDEGKASVEIARTKKGTSIIGAAG